MCVLADVMVATIHMHEHHTISKLLRFVSYTRGAFCPVKENAVPWVQMRVAGGYVHQDDVPCMASPELQ